MTTQINIAMEIYNQLGANRFSAMTGAKNFVDCGNALSFKLPRSKNGINYVKIKLNSMDLYDIEFGKIANKCKGYKVVNTVSDIYNDQLQSIFTENTGLYTRL